MNRQQKRNAKICYDCSQPADLGRTRCSKHRKSNVVVAMKYQATESGKVTIKKLVRWKLDWIKAYRRANGRFNYVKSHALRRKKEWTLTEAGYLFLINQPCFYCNLKSDVEAGIGLDRLDNTQGYVEGNVVPCCSICNYVRGDRFNPQEMKLLGSVIKQIKLTRLDGKCANELGKEVK